MRVSFKLLHKHYYSIQFLKIDDILFELNCLSSENHTPIKQTHSLASPRRKYTHTVKNHKNQIKWQISQVKWSLPTFSGFINHASITTNFECPTFNHLYIFYEGNIVIPFNNIVFCSMCVTYHPLNWFSVVLIMYLSICLSLYALQSFHFVFELAQSEPL